MGVSDPDDAPYRWLVAELPRRRDTSFEIVPTQEDCSALAGQFAVTELRKLRFRGALRPVGRADWSLEGQLGATVIQPCVVSLEPVTTRLEERIARRYVADPEELPAPGSETEMTADETEEPLGQSIDLWAVMVETLTLSIPAYPRAEDAEGGSQVFAPPGVAPMTDDEARPFAGLADLKAKLTPKD